jgi:hypothetical protein
MVVARRRFVTVVVGDGGAFRWTWNLSGGGLRLGRDMRSVSRLRLCTCTACRVVLCAPHRALYPVQLPRGVT